MLTDLRLLSDPKEIMRGTLSLLADNAVLTPGLQTAIERRAEDGLIGYEFISELNSALSILKKHNQIKAEWVLDLLLVHEPSLMSEYAKALCKLAEHNLLLPQNWDTLKSAPIYFSHIVQKMAEVGILNQDTLDTLLTRQYSYDKKQSSLSLFGDGNRFYEVMCYLHEIDLLTMANFALLLEHWRVAGMRDFQAILLDLCSCFPAEKHQAVFNFVVHRKSRAHELVDAGLASLEMIERFNADMNHCAMIFMNFIMIENIKSISLEERKAVLDSLFAVNPDYLGYVVKAYNNLIKANLNLADYHTIIRDYDDYADIITEGVINLAKAGILNKDLLDYLIDYKSYAIPLAEAFILLHQHGLLNTHHINLLLDNKHLAVNLAKSIIEDPDRFQGIINQEVWEEIYEQDERLQALDTVKELLGRSTLPYDISDLANAGTKIYDLEHIVEWIKYNPGDDDYFDEHNNDYDIWMCSLAFVRSLKKIIEHASELREAVDLSQVSGCCEHAFKLFLSNIDNCRELAVVVSGLRPKFDDDYNNIHKYASVLIEPELLDLLGRLPTDLDTGYSIFKICDKAISDEDKIAEIQTFLNRALRQYIQAGKVIDRQSTHTASVHATVSRSARKLFDLYHDKINEIPKLEAVIESIKEYGSHQEDPILQRAIADLCSHSYHYIDPVSEVSFRQLFALTWIAIHDDSIRIGSKEDVLNAFNQGLIENQREYNNTEEDADAPSCLSGAFNKLIEILYSHHPDVDLLLINIAGFSSKLPRVVTEEAASYLKTLSAEEAKPLLDNIDESKDASSVWPLIRDKVAARMLEEFGTLFTSAEDPRFITNLDYGSFTELSREQLVERASLPVLAMIMGGGSASAEDRPDFAP